MTNKNLKLFELIKKGKFNEFGCFEWLGPLDKDGYGITTFSQNKNRKTWKVHRLIFLILQGNIPKDKFICHACDNPKCFNINHLFIGTSKENAQDRDRKGRKKVLKGEENGSSKLTPVTVLLIRKLYSQGRRICELVKIFNLKQPTISKIVHRKRWKHI